MDYERQLASRMTPSARRAVVADLKPESELQAAIVDLLLAQPTVRWAKINQGPREYGKDIVCKVTDGLNDYQYVAFVVKVGDVSGAAVAASGTLSTIQRQVDQCFEQPYDSLDEAGEVRIDRVVVAVSGRFSNNAEEQIARASRDKQRTVRFWDGDELTRQFLDHFPSVFSPVNPELAKYLQALEASCNDLSAEFRRLGWGSSDTAMSLTEMFVRPSLIRLHGQPLPRARERLGPTKLVTHDSGDDGIISLPELERSTRSALLIGQPGSGKTILLRKIGIQLATNRLHSQQGPIPYLVNASALSEALLSRDASQAIEILQACSFGTVQAEAAFPEEDWAAGNVTLLVDGLDECASTNHMDEVLRFVALLDGRGIRCILASRVDPPDFRTLCHRLEQYALLPLSQRAITELVHNVLGGGKRTTSLLRSLLKSNLLRSLPQTPLVVLILAVLHEHEDMDEVPANIASLYDLVLQVHLGKYASSRHNLGGLKEYELRDAMLRELAVAMHNSRTSSISERDAANISCEHLQTRGYDSHTVKALFEDMLGRSAVLTQSAGGLLRFSHHSFQEFFAAKWFHEDSRRAADLPTAFYDYWWTNVVVMYAGLRRDASELLDAIVTVPPPENMLGLLHPALQLGGLLQAASEATTTSKTQGCLHGSDLLQAFYAACAQRAAGAGTGRHIGRLQLSFMLAVLFSMNYSSRYLHESVSQSFDTLLDRFANTSGGEREMLGLRALFTALALRRDGDGWAHLELFVQEIRKSDLAILQSVAAIAELYEPGDNSDEQTSWNNLIRQIRRTAPKVDMKGLRRLSRTFTKLDTPPALQDLRVDPQAQMDRSAPPISTNTEAEEAESSSSEQKLAPGAASSP